MCKKFELENKNSNCWRTSSSGNRTMKNELFSSNYRRVSSVWQWNDIQCKQSIVIWISWAGIHESLRMSYFPSLVIMESIEAFIMQSSLTLWAPPFSSFIAESTLFVCWTCRRKVSNTIKTDISRHRFPQRGWSRSNRSTGPTDSAGCRMILHQTHIDNLPSESKKVVWLVLSFFVSSIEKPSILHHHIWDPNKQRPPPFLRPNTDSVCWDVLISSVNASHLFVVFPDAVGLWDKHLCLCIATISFNFGLRTTFLTVWNKINNFVVFPSNHSYRIICCCALLGRTTFLLINCSLSWDVACISNTILTQSSCCFYVVGPEKLHQSKAGKEVIHEHMVGNISRENIKKL